MVNLNHSLPLPSTALSPSLSLFPSLPLSLSHSLTLSLPLTLYPRSPSLPLLSLVQFHDKPYNADFWSTPLKPSYQASPRLL